MPPDERRSVRVFDAILIVAILLLAVGLVALLWSHSMGFLNSAAVMGIVMFGASVVILLLWASLISRIRFKRTG